MIYLAITLGLSNVGLITLVYTQSTNARLERKALEDRLIALSNPQATAVVMAVEDDTPNRVSYVDEPAEYAHQRKNGHPDLLGDD